MPLPLTDALLEADANAALANLVTALAPIQNRYFARRGRYWQGVSTRDAPPANGVLAEPDTQRRPTDQAENWTDVEAPLPATLPCALRVDVWQGEDGAGYVVTASFSWRSRVYTKAVAVGDDTRNHDWRLVSEAA